MRIARYELRLSGDASQKPVFSDHPRAKEPKNLYNHGREPDQQYFHREAPEFQLPLHDMHSSQFGNLLC